MGREPAELKNAGGRSFLPPERLSKNRFAGFYSPQNEFCGGPILFDRLWSPELRAPAPYAALTARPRRAVAPARGPVSPNFCENLAGYGVFSRRMSVKKHPIRKSLRFRRLFRQAGRRQELPAAGFLMAQGNAGKRQLRLPVLPQSSISPKAISSWSSAPAGCSSAGRQFPLCPSRQKGSVQTTAMPTCSRA